MRFADDTVFFDIESHSVTEMGSMPAAEYCRLFQWAWGEGAVHTTTDLAVFRRVLAKARMIVGANIIDFDLRAVFGDTMVAVKLARQGRLYDTHVASLTANPPPFGVFEPYTGGKPLRCVDPPEFRKWIKLDQQAYSLGVQGKSADLTELTDKYAFTHEPVLTKTGKPSMSKGVPRTRKVPIEGICCQYSAIPVDDPEFVEYAERDVTVVREVTRKLLEREPYSEYTKTTMIDAANNVQIGKGNGFTVDQPAARQRVVDMHETAAHVLDWLRDTYVFPVSGKKPMATKDGKAALLRALADHGVQESALPRTEPTDAHPTGQPSFSAENILSATKDAGDDARALGEAVATLAGQRSLAELLLNEVHPDGRVHPDIFPLQRSGRNSTTKPGLTIWDPRFKDLLIADNDDELLVEFDYSNADARAVAAMSGDAEFARRFEPGQDGHMINAWLLWGKDTVGTDKHDKVTARYRQWAKAPGHGIGYNMGAKKMAETTGLSLAECKTFIKNYRAAYAGVVSWQKRVVERAQRYGYIVSDWGRRMPVQPGREHTQTPGLLGQNATHEILSAGIRACDERHLRMIKVGIHDAFIASIPKATLQADIEYFVRTFSMTWHPRGGQAVDFTLGYGEPSRDWAAAQH